MEHNAPSQGGIYDHKRECAERRGIATLQYDNKDKSDHSIWDFVFYRNDGTAFWLHPEWSKHVVPYGEVEPHQEQIQPPENGRGGSGIGHFKSYKHVATLDTFHFDKNKMS